MSSKKIDCPLCGGDIYPEHASGSVLDKSTGIVTMVCVKCDEKVTNSKTPENEQVDTCLSKNAKSDNQTDLSIKESKQTALEEFKSMMITAGGADEVKNWKIAEWFRKYWFEIEQALTMQEVDLKGMRKEVLGDSEIWFKNIGYNQAIDNLNAQGYLYPPDTKLRDAVRDLAKNLRMVKSEIECDCIDSQTTKRINQALKTHAAAIERAGGE